MVCAVEPRGISVEMFVTELNLQCVSYERSSLILCVLLLKLPSAAFSHACSWKAAGTFGQSVLLREFQHTSSRCLP
jgi:hypothetical protein